MKDISVLDRMQGHNLDYFKELSLYILAGKQKIKEVEEGPLRLAQEKAKSSNLPEDADALNALHNQIDRFSKKLHDLELSRMISIQTAPQIRIIQNSNELMLEKIQSAIVNTIPLWQSQMILAISLQNTEKALQEQRAVSESTNELLKKNAETLRTGAVSVAKESERSIVDVDTLKRTNDSLIKTLEDVKRAQEEGQRKRAEASEELARAEDDLKERIIEIGLS
jgi:uncharacterized protein YaaN involved in tellurite resistance